MQNRPLVTLMGLLVGLLLATPAQAQFDLPAPENFNPFGSSGEQNEPVIIATAQFTAGQGGEPARLFVTATIKPGWHIYSVTQGPGGPVATQIKLKPSQQYRQIGEFRAITAPDKKNEPLYNNIVVETHHGQITWYAPIELATGIDPAAIKIDGAINVQACEENKSCNMPEDFPFAASLGQGVAIPSSPMAAAVGGTSPGETAPLDWSALVVQLGFAFLGGLILNVMPCVLPVISLKILSFLQQAGERRSRIFMLNVWYSLGVLSVFMILAALAVSLQQAWGEQFTLPWFKIGMTGLVFAMALSFLGVWEIPIPGFVGRGAASELQTKEGASGAFFKGVFATVLATPCSGPFLGPVFAYVLTQPPLASYCLFGAVGLGMASPYLLIGAFPGLIRFLPRPGAWMETAKQVMAFLLLGTVVYLFTTLTPTYFVPTLTMLMGIWFGAWLIGRVPLTVGPTRRAVAWVASIVCAAAIGLFAFTVLLHQPKLPWQPFSSAALDEARQEGKTVMVDFTANWCLTCKANLAFAIETDRVKKLVDENRVVPLLADWTDKSPTIKKAINDLGHNSIPLLVIWPAGSDQPIILTDLLTEGKVLEKLKEAGPSRPQGTASAGLNRH